MNQVKKMVVASVIVGLLASLEATGVREGISNWVESGLGNWVSDGCPLTLLPFFHILCAMTICIVSCMVTCAMYANTYINIDVSDEPACDTDAVELPAMYGDVRQVFQVWVLGAARCEKVYALKEVAAKATHISDEDLDKARAFEEAYARWTNVGVKLTR